MASMAETFPIPKFNSSCTMRGDFCIIYVAMKEKSQPSLIPNLFEGTVFCQKKNVNDMKQIRPRLECFAFDEFYF
jgi:hypothetical protein